MPVRLLSLGRMTEMGPPGALCQVAEIVTADMHERLVIAALEIDIGGIAETLVEDDRHTVSRAYRRDRADIAILEQRAGLIFGSKAEPLVHDVLQRAELDPMRAWHHGK